MDTAADEATHARAPKQISRPSAVGIALGVIAVALVLVATQFPRSGDDWAWGTSIGTARLDTFFAGYNGRYLGNLTVLALMHATWVIPLVIALTLCLLMWLVADLAGQRDLVGVVASAALLVAMPLVVWQQTVVWVAGFTNYAFATVALLVFLRSTRRDLEGGSPRLGAASGVGLFVLAVAGQLFIEHVTIFVVIASIGVVAARLFVRSLRLTARSVVWAVGSLTGAAMMFSNSAYWGTSQSGDQYQHLGEASAGHSKIVAAILQGTGGISQYAVAINLVLNGALLALVACLVLLARQRTGTVRPLQAAAVVLAVVGFASGAAVGASVQSTHYFGQLSGWSWVPALSMFSAIVLSGLSLVDDRRRATTVVALAVAVVVLIAPLAAVKPYGPRNFLPSYVMMAAIALLLLAEIRSRLRSPSIGGTVAVLGGVTLVAVLTGYFVIYHVIAQAGQERLTEIRQAVASGHHSARVYTLPYPGYVHVGDPVPGGWEAEYELYYRIPADFRIHLVDRYARLDLGSTSNATAR